MQSELRPLGDFVTLASGNTPSKANADYWGGGTPWVSAKDMGDFWVEDAEDHLTPEGVAVASRLVPAGTVLLLVRGMTLHKRVPICKLAKAATFNQDVKAVQPKAGFSGRFLPYLLVGNHDRLHELVDSAGHGTGRLNTDALLSFPVFVPSRAQQDGIADIGEAFDDRLRLLRQTNATLESIAQALFKSWFIDFDPVRAKAEGREPEGMDAATAALFPADFVHSELGPVPRGWRVQPIGDLVDAVGGSTPDTKNEAFWEPAVHHWTSPKDLSGATAPVLLDTERRVSNAGLAKISSGLLPVGTLLMSSRAPIGYLSLSQVPVAINQGYIAMPPGGRLPPTYLYFWCQLNMGAIKGRANGSTFMEISKKAFRPIPALLPSPEVVNRFQEFAITVFSRVTANERQARALAEVRDALLPRLVSGKLQLQEVEVEGEGEGEVAQA
ncbi:restriction endonuclease subunit S [Alicycliphilus denitrificans]|uniref:restriction endonuclease subunit S n=1 Tax=Alicycliphilus denitrificans TaxID=179636 RepID=UPI003A7FBF05